MEVNAINGKESPEHVTAEVEIEPSSEEKGKRDKVDCSHRVIEKRRRDRINNSLMQLSKLVPIDKFNKKNSGKLEKAEILEETVRYLTEQQQFKKEDKDVTETTNGADEENFQTKKDPKKNELTTFLHGFKQCVSDATKFFKDVEELDVSEGRCYRLIQYLKREISSYESKERKMSTDVVEERLVWEDEDSNDVSERSLSSVSSKKRKSSEDMKASFFKKPRSASNQTDTGKMDQPSNGTESDRSTDNSPTNSSSETASNSGSTSSSSRNYMPFVFPNIPLFTTLPFAGANNMPFQTSPTQFPGYQYQQSPQYIPVALPQFPPMGMNFMSGFGVVNNEQSQSASMTNSVQNGIAVHTQMAGQPMPNLLPVGMPNGFFPSMYTNGFHANLMSMRPSDSGYESSEKSSSSKGSGSETSPQSFSDDSCQSYVT